MISRDFFTQNTSTIARQLLGTRLVHLESGRRLSGLIVETEAYRGEEDQGCHARAGLTPRTRVMYGQPGHAYVYFTYGMHFCTNVVTERKGVAGAVLLRAIEPVQGLERMRQLRGKQVGDTNLTNGPAKLCQAFGILREANGVDLLGDEIFLARAPGESPGPIGSSTRVGIKVATERRWRFFLKGNPWVSVQR